jgi:acyl-CoA-binding protein
MRQMENDDDFTNATAFVAANSGLFSNEILLKLYAFYKVATVGPCIESNTLKRPSGLFDFSARAKVYISPNRITAKGCMH